MDIDDPVELHDIIHVSDELRQELVDKLLRGDSEIRS